MNAFPTFPVVRFSCALDLGLEAELNAALDLYGEFRAAAGSKACFAAEPLPHSSSSLWFHDENGKGDPAQLVGFVKNCAKAFGLTGLWCFNWNSFDPRFTLNAVSGGCNAIDLLTGEIVTDLDYRDWIATEFKRRRTFIIYSPSESHDHQDAGYWSNERDWTTVDHATKFAIIDRLRLDLPISRGQDAGWIEIPIPPLGAKTRR